MKNTWLGVLAVALSIFVPTIAAEKNQEGDATVQNVSAKGAVESTEPSHVNSRSRGFIYPKVKEVGAEASDASVEHAIGTATPGSNSSRISTFSYPRNYSHQQFLNPPVIESERGSRELHYQLNAQYAAHQFQTLQAGNQVVKTLTLRSYNGKLIGPTLVARPGDTLKIRLNNLLPPDSVHCHHGNPDCDPHKPHNFNTTNLHTHGLHVDPTGRSDNVFISLHSGESMDYEIHIPEDHPAGTFWYHAHLHGSTTVQVGSGMHGALIVRNDYDRLPAIRAATERVMVLQTIAFDTYGTIENNDNFFVNKWHTEGWKNGWHFSLNGQVMPEITMRAGSVELWRFVHAGVREPANLRLINACESNYDVPMVQVAADGIPFSSKRLAEDKGSFIAPGYRSDVLVKPLHEGVYYLVDTSVNQARLPDSYCDTKRGATPFDLDTAAQDIIARVAVKGDVKKPMMLPTNAELARLNRPRSISDEELVSEVQIAEFNIVPKDGVDPSDPTQFIGDNFHFLINGKSFDPDRSRVLKLNTAQTWYANAVFADHPFHIHVNPFEVIKRDSSGKIIDRYWRDTVILRQPLPGEDPLAQLVEFRMRYEKFAGAFVLHCHILDHEDRGMMEKVEIKP